MKGSPRKKQRSGILFAAMIANADTGNCVICYTVPAAFVSAQQKKRLEIASRIVQGTMPRIHVIIIFA